MVNRQESDMALDPHSEPHTEISKGIEQTADWKHLLLLMTTLRKEFAEATSILPAYDLRQCELVSRS